jgi:CBS domain-containing protein
MSQKLHKIMIENVVTIKPNDTVKKAAERMNLHEISSLIVVDADKPVGIVTERDMLSRVLNKPLLPYKTLVIRIMTRPVVTASPDMRAGDAAKLMLERNIKKLPIVENGGLIGIVSLTDLLRSEGVVQLLNKMSLNGTSLRMKKAISLYFDAASLKKRKCPLLTEQGFHIGCIENKCMWWTGEECAVTNLSRQFTVEQMNENMIDA